jgi:hypothetical protein
MTFSLASVRLKVSSHSSRGVAPVPVWSAVIVFIEIFLILVSVCECSGSPVVLLCPPSGSVLLHPLATHRIVVAKVSAIKRFRHVLVYGVDLVRHWRRAFRIDRLKVLSHSSRRVAPVPVRSQVDHQISADATDAPLTILDLLLRPCPTPYSLITPHCQLRLLLIQRPLMLRTRFP